jgi:hypothetical protein
MKKLVSSILLLALSLSVMAVPAAQDPSDAKPQTVSTSTTLTNKDVHDMIKAGLATEVIVAKIKSSPASFDTTPTALAELKSANVPDAIILAMVNGPTAMADANTEGVSVPDGTEIEIQLINNASGEELKVGSLVDFEVVKPVVFNGVTIFEKQARARARITTAKRAGHWGKAGKLEWAMQDILAVDGNRIPARFTQRQIGDSKGGTVAIAAVATTVFLGPLGLLWGLKKGKPAIIPAGNRYNVFVSGDTKIKGKAAEAAAVTP